MGGAIGSSPACWAGGLGSNPGPGENFFLKLTTKDLPDSWSENLIFNWEMLFIRKNANDAVNFDILAENGFIRNIVSSHQNSQNQSEYADDGINGVVKTFHLN